MVSQYRLATKIIDGQIYTRLDFPEDTQNKIAARTVVTNGKEIICFNPITNEVQMRGPVPDTFTDSLSEFSERPRSLFQKLDIAQMRTRLASLNCDIQGTEDGKKWVVEFPQTLLTRYNVTPEQTTQSFKVYLDEATGTVAGSEQIAVEDDGTILTTKVTNIYEEKDGVPIPIGIVQEQHVDEPYTIDTSDSCLPPYDENSAPVISEEESQELIESGQALAIDVMTGDPSDPDYTEQTITVYDSIELNTAPDILFKVF
jgi:hypothetical protein